MVSAFVPYGYGRDSFVVAKKVETLVWLEQVRDAAGSYNSDVWRIAQQVYDTIADRERVESLKEKNKKMFVLLITSKDLPAYKDAQKIREIVDGAVRITHEVIAPSPFTALVQSLDRASPI